MEKHVYTNKEVRDLWQHLSALVSGFSFVKECGAWAVAKKFNLSYTSTLERWMDNSERLLKTIPLPAKEE